MESLKKAENRLQLISGHMVAKKKVKVMDSGNQISALIITSLGLL
jgi:Flp pilus assembly protein TadB